MNTGTLHISDWKFACRIGARRLPPVGPYLFIETDDETAPALFWEVDPKALPRERAS